MELAFVTLPKSSTAQIAESRLRLRILATSDLHMHLVPYDYARGQVREGFSLARVAGLAEAFRRAQPNSLLVDNGDFLQGGQMGDYARSSDLRAPGGLHPAIAAMNEAGYDVATLGNHEFSFGIDFLRETIGQAAFPFVSANLRMAPGQPRLVPPWVILERRFTDTEGQLVPLRIGVIGFTPPGTIRWDHGQIARKLRIADIIRSARAEIPRLRAAGADLVLALAHCGLDEEDEACRPGGGEGGREGSAAGAPDAPPPGDGRMPGIARQLAALEGIDALVLGHSHQVFPGPSWRGQAGLDFADGLVEGKPAVMPGFWGSHLGVIDLTLARRPFSPAAQPQAWRVVSGRGSAWPVASDKARAGLPDIAKAPMSAAVLRAVERPHREMLHYCARPVGHCRTPLHSHFALLGIDPVGALTARAMRNACRPALLGTELEHLPLLAACAPHKAGGRAGPLNYIDIPAGQVLERHLNSLYPHPNTICVLRIGGADLRRWLERSARAFSPVAEGTLEAPLLDPAFAPHHFDSIYGITYEIDIGSGGARIRELRFRGRPIEEDAAFALAVNSHRAHGGGDFPMTGPEHVVVDTGAQVRQALRRELAAGAPPERGRAWKRPWKFLRPGNATVLFETGPGARAHLGAIAEFSPRILGHARDGHLRLRLAM